jgi:hypothetical protein
MDQRVKKLIDKNVFKTNILDYEIIPSRKSIDGYKDIIFKIFIDHYKLWKSSGYFDREYYDLILGIDDGLYNEELSDFLPLIGYDFDYFTIRFGWENDNDYSAYERLFDAIDELGYKAVPYSYKEKPWLYVGTSLSSSNLVELVISLEDEFDLDVDDIVFT